MGNFNENVWDIWDKYSDVTYPLSRAPLIYPEFNRGGFLCVGMNPSFSSGDAYLNSQSSSFKGLTKNEFYSIKVAKKFGSNWEKEEFNQQIQSFMKHPYHTLYRHIKEQILTPLAVDFQYIDLFPIRETSQKTMLTLLQKEKTNKTNYPNLNEFGNDLLRAFIEMLNFISPDYLMINNAEVSHMLLSHFKVGRQKDFDQEKGCYHLCISGKNVPLLCSGMLSGQRALDVYSRERLFWHIGAVIKGVV